MKHRWSLLSAALILSALITGQSFSQQPSKTEIKIGFVPGPYIDEFKAGVEPELRKKGYSVRYFEFSTGLEANSAVFRDDIDADVMQHTVFLKSYNDRNKTDLAGSSTCPPLRWGFIRRNIHAIPP
jgi:D-methionine transport system substrate-binding protein